MRRENKWQVAIVAVLGLFMSVLDLSIVNVALPQMQHAFDTDFETIIWVATAYFLAQAAVIPVAGYLSDRVGTKAVFVATLALFVLGSALCAVAPTKEALIAFRVVQGVGGGALLPIGFAIIFRAFPPAERGPASAVGGVAVLLAPVLGPTIGGYLTTTFDWRAIFTINLPLGALALVLALLVLQGRAAEQAASGESSEPSPKHQRFDVLGLLLAMAGFTTLVYGITQAGANGWNDTIFQTFSVGGLTIQLSVLRYLLVGGALLLVFVVNELVVSAPVLDVRLFRRYTFSMANLLNWALGAFIFGSLFLLPFFLENVQGRTPLAAGEILITQGVGAAVATFAAGALYNRVGPRILVTAGFVLMAVATLGLRQLDVGTTWQSLQVWLVLRGAAFGLANIPLQTLAVSVVSNRAMARASSLVNVTRTVFSAVGVAALTAYLTQQAHAHGTDIAAAFRALPPSGVAANCLAAVGPSLPALSACAQQYATTMGLNDTFTVLMLGCAAAALLALLLGRDPAVEAVKRKAVQGEPAAMKRPSVLGAMSALAVGRRRRPPASQPAAAEEAPVAEPATAGTQPAGTTGDLTRAALGLTLTMLAREAAAPAADPRLIAALSDAVDGRYPPSWSDEQRAQAIVRDMIEPLAHALLGSSAANGTGASARYSAAPAPSAAAGGNWRSGESRPLKRVRVTRRLMEGNRVVGEQALEEYVPLDADSEAAAAALRARLDAVDPGVMDPTESPTVKLR